MERSKTEINIFRSMNKFEKIFYYLIHKPSVFGIMGLEKLSFLIPDKPYLQMMYWLKMGKRLNLKNPKTFNEKLQWLKLYNRKPEYTIMVDKVKAKEYVANIIGEEYIIPTLGVWDDPDDIDFDALPNQFVLKCNHNSGTGMCICRDKSKLDIPKVKAELRKGLKENYFLHGREWPYKDVPRKILAEKFMVDESGTDLRDYKFFCCNGEVDNVMVCCDRESGHAKFYFFDRQWKLMRCNLQGKNAPKDFTLEKPKNMDRMFEIASILSKGVPFLRVDLFNIGGHIYFGETTFFPQSGFDGNYLPETDIRFGSLIHL